MYEQLTYLSGPPHVEKGPLLVGAIVPPYQDHVCSCMLPAANSKSYLLLSSYPLDKVNLVDLSFLFMILSTY